MFWLYVCHLVILLTAYGRLWKKSFYKVLNLPPPSVHRHKLRWKQWRYFGVWLSMYIECNWKFLQICRACSSVRRSNLRRETCGRKSLLHKKLGSGYCEFGATSRVPFMRSLWKKKRIWQLKLYQRVELLKQTRRVWNGSRNMVRSCNDWNIMGDGAFKQLLSII